MWIPPQGFGIEFRTDANGEINEINAAFEPTVKTIVFTRIPKATADQTDSLKKYEGEYYDRSDDLKNVSFKMMPCIYLFRASRNMNWFRSIADKFAIKDMTGFTISFEGNEKNEVISLTSSQPNGTFKAWRETVINVAPDTYFTINYLTTNN